LVVETSVVLEMIPIGVSSVFLDKPVPLVVEMEVVKAFGEKYESST